MMAMSYVWWKCLFLAAALVAAQVQEEEQAPDTAVEQQAASGQQATQADTAVEQQAASGQQATQDGSDGPGEVAEEAAKEAEGDAEESAKEAEGLKTQFDMASANQAEAAKNAEASAASAKRLAAEARDVGQIFNQVQASHDQKAEEAADAAENDMQMQKSLKAATTRHHQVAHDVGEALSVVADSEEIMEDAKAAQAVHVSKENTVRTKIKKAEIDATKKKEAAQQAVAHEAEMQAALKAARSAQDTAEEEFKNASKAMKAAESATSKAKQDELNSKSEHFHAKSKVKWTSQRKKVADAHADSVKRMVDEAHLYQEAAKEVGAQAEDGQAGQAQAMLR